MHALPDTLHITVHLEDGSLWATVKEFPGVFATGDNLDELRESLQEGIALYETTRDQGYLIFADQYEPSQPAEFELQAPPKA